MQKVRRLSKELKMSFDRQSVDAHIFDQFKNHRQGIICSDMDELKKDVEFWNQDE